MVWPGDFFTGNFSRADCIEYVFEQPALGIADANHQVPVLVPVAPRQVYGSFAIDQAGDVGCVGGVQILDILVHSFSLFVLSREIINQRQKQKTPAVVSAGAQIGGDGGTADPHLSIWAGLFLHLPVAAGEGVLWASAHPSTPWVRPLGAYESLAGLPVSRSPDGVGVGQCPLAFTV